jgi:hypothetical protein
MNRPTAPRWTRLAGQLGAATALALAGLPSLSWADTAYPATLAGHALLPARSFIAAPQDAPADLHISGKFTTGQRVERVGSVQGTSAGRPTGVLLPFQGQPLQGHSGIQRMADGSFWLLSDNGAGSKANSPDFMLFLNRYAVDFKTGEWQRLQTVFLHDPDKKLPFRLVHEGSAKRYLTGADLDPEAFQIVDGHFWIGDEFGPYLIQADIQGRVRAVFETQVDGKPVVSPDHPSVRTPNTPGSAVTFQLPRSKGFEGLAASPDGSKLYAMLEGALWDEARAAPETHNGQTALRVLEFDVATAQWTSRHWKYLLEAGHHAIGDFNLINATTGLVIERDNGEGTPDQTCPAGQRRPDCFHNPAQFKRVYKVEMNEANVGGPLRKIGHIDLLNIADPQRLARQPLVGGVFSLPFVTIENVAVVDERHIVVGNDNNLPFSSSRHPNQADDNELVLLEVEALLRAR